MLENTECVEYYYVLKNTEIYMCVWLLLLLLCVDTSVKITYKKPSAEKATPLSELDTKKK